MPPSWEISDHWSAASSALSGWSGRRCARTGRVKVRSEVSRAKTGPSRLRSSFWPNVGRARCSSMLPLKSNAPASSIPSSPARSRAISSVATEVPMSWATRKTGGEPGPADDVLGCVGLPGQRVDVVGGLLGEAEAEEVEGDARLVASPRLEQRPPVVGARREPVQVEQQRRFAALARCGRRGGGRAPPRSPPRAASARPARSARGASEPPPQPPVAVAEDESDQRPQRAAGEAESWLPADAVGDQAPGAGRLERALVFPDPLAQHRRALEEAASRDRCRPGSGRRSRTGPGRRARPSCGRSACRARSGPGRAASTPCGIVIRMIGRISSLIPAGVVTRSQTAAGSASSREETRLSRPRRGPSVREQPSLPYPLRRAVQETLATRMASRDAAHFVGRTEELARLEGLLEESAPISVHLLHGPAGVGKSALLRELARHAEARGHGGGHRRGPRSGAAGRGAR